MKTREYAPLDAVLARVSCLLILALLNACVTGGDNPPVAGSGGTLGASQSIVGMAVYVPKQDLGSPIAAGRGKQVFENLEGDGCVVQDPLAGVSDGRVHTWTSTKAYYGYLKTDTSLDASLTNAAVLSTSLDVVSRRATDRSTEIAGSVYEFNAYKQLFSLASECEDGRQNKGELDNDLTTTFNALPYPVERPDQTRSWDPYRRFLIDFGSHYVSQVKAGARYRSYSFKKSVTDVKESDLTIAACVSAQGVPTETGEVSVKGCENIDKKEAESIKLMDYTSTATAFGGKQDIRERLAAGETVSPELLSQFAATDGAAQDGVQYSLEPIWDLLASRAETDKQRNQARALQAYFEGFFAFNCDQVHGCGCSSTTLSLDVSAPPRVAAKTATAITNTALRLATIASATGITVSSGTTIAPRSTAPALTVRIRGRTDLATINSAAGANALDQPKTSYGTPYGLARNRSA
jgi:hypothetical protein